MTNGANGDQHAQHSVGATAAEAMGGTAPPSDSTLPPPGGVQALPNDALDFAAKVRRGHEALTIQLPARQSDTLALHCRCLISHDRDP
jgi:hypothetical protein